MTNMTHESNHGNYDERTDTVYDANIYRWVPADIFYARYGIKTYSDDDTRMSRLKIVGLAFAGVVVFLLILLASNLFTDEAPSLQSNEQSYLDQASQAVVSVHGDGELLENGYIICGLLQDGYTPEQISGSVVVTNTDKYGEDAATYQQILQVVRAADTYLC